jgi:hypothetical protein
MSIVFTISCYNPKTKKRVCDYEFPEFDLVDLRRIFELSDQEEFEGVFYVIPDVQVLLAKKYDIKFDSNLHYECELIQNDPEALERITTIPKPTAKDGFYPPPKYLKAFPDAVRVATYL